MTDDTFNIKAIKVKKYVYVCFNTKYPVVANLFTYLLFTY